MKFKTLVCGMMLAMSSLTATAERIDLGRFNHWDAYKLTFDQGTPDDPNVRWLCASRGFFTDERGKNYKVIFAFYNTGLAKFFVEDGTHVFRPGFNLTVPVRVLNQHRQEIFAALGKYENRSKMEVKQIGYQTNIDFIKAVFEGAILQTGLPNGETMNFDISDMTFNQSLGTTIETCLLKQTIPLSVM